MIGWAVSIALIAAWVKVPDANVSMLCASGLFAIAGSIGHGLSKVANKID